MKIIKVTKIIIKMKWKNSNNDIVVITEYNSNNGNNNNHENEIKEMGLELYVINF